MKNLLLSILIAIAQTVFWWTTVLVALVIFVNYNITGNVTLLVFYYTLPIILGFTILNLIVIRLQGK